MGKYQIINITIAAEHRMIYTFYGAKRYQNYIFQKSLSQYSTRCGLSVKVLNPSLMETWCQRAFLKKFENIITSSCKKRKGQLLQHILRN